MKCVDVEEKLPSYLEGGLLSPEEKRLVEEHLKTCSQCSSSLEDLKMTVNLLKDLPEVEPPPWFTQKVMAQVHAQTGQKSSLVKKLFYPFHIKIPIEACATLMVALLGVYIYQSTMPETDTISHAPQANVEQAAPKTVTTKDQVWEEKDSSVGITKNDNKKPSPTEHLQKPYATADLPAVTSISKENKQEGIPDQKRNRLDTTTPSAPLAKQKEALSSAGGAQPHRSTMPDKNDAVQVSVQVADIQAALGEIEQILSKLNVHVLLRKSHNGKEYIDVQAQPERAMELLHQLRGIGIVQDNLPTMKLRENSVIRIEVTRNATSR